MKIKVYVLDFGYVITHHAEIVLTYEDQDTTYYYRIDRWSDPKTEFKPNNKICMKLIKNADEKIILDIEADVNEIIKAWQERFEEDDADVCEDNCSDAVQWFLEKYTEVGTLPGKCAKPVSCDRACFCFFVPSFLQCCSLPSRVMKGTHHKIDNDKIRTSNEDKPSELIMKYNNN